MISLPYMFITKRTIASKYQPTILFTFVNLDIQNRNPDQKHCLKGHFSSRQEIRTCSNLQLSYKSSQS